MVPAPTMATRRMGPGLDEIELDGTELDETGPGETELDEARPDEAGPDEAEPDEAELVGAMLDMQVSFVGFAAL